MNPATCRLPGSMRPLLLFPDVTLGVLAAGAAGASTVELPAPTGPHAVGTTTWRLTDKARQETFGEGGGFRQVEVLAWYPAVGIRSGGERAPYLREGLSRCRASPSAWVRRRRSTGWPGSDPCRAGREARGRSEEASGPRVLARLHRDAELLHRAARRPREPWLRGAQHRAPLRGRRRDAGGWARGRAPRRRRRDAQADPRRPRRVGRGGRHDGRGDEADGRRGPGRAAAQVSLGAPADRSRLEALGGRHPARPGPPSRPCRPTPPPAGSPPASIWAGSACSATRWEA